MSTSSLVLIQQAISRYVLPITLSLGNVGNLILMVVFLQKHHRKNACSHYLLSNTVLSIISSNFVVVLTIYSADHRNPSSDSLVFCRAQAYIAHSCDMSFRTLLVLVAADRFALTSTRQSFRSFSSIKIARRMIIGVPIFWFVLSVHLLIWPYIENAQCFISGLYGQIYSIYLVTCAAILPIVLLFLFLMLTMKNIRSSRNRVGATTTQQQQNSVISVLRSRDRNLLKLVITEIIVYFICTFPYTINSGYSVLTSNIPDKSNERLQIESFLTFIAQWCLLYLKYSTSFYVYSAASKAFRDEVKTLLIKTIKVVRQKTRNNSTL